jgi:hypothetical protein
MVTTEANGGAPVRYREVMPGVWAQLEAWRAAWGAPYVAEAVRRGMAGQPGWFWAMEAGYVVGTPFRADADLMRTLALGVAIGGSMAAVMRPPAAQEGT